MPDEYETITGTYQCTLAHLVHDYTQQQLVCNAMPDEYEIITGALVHNKFALQWLMNMKP